MIRSAFKAKRSPKKIRENKCKVCKGLFVKRSMTHKCCGPECAQIFAISEREKIERKAASKDRADTRLKLDAMKRKSELIAKAQESFNAFIRYRDRNETCIDCGKPFEPQKPGGSIDAGHYLSRGSAPHLRFNENNCFAQRKNCNRPGGATKADFRAGVERRIGAEALTKLEYSQEITKLTHDDLRAIDKKYRDKLKELKNKSFNSN